MYGFQEDKARGIGLAAGKGTEESAYAVQMVQNTIDNLQAVNSDIQTTMDEIDTYMQRLNDTRSSLSTTHDKNEKIMQNFAKLLCVD